MKKSTDKSNDQVNITPYQEFAKAKLGFEFKNPELLVEALTHRSYVNEHKKSSKHNERLEFLGDAVLELVVSDFLYRNYDKPEGIMTAWRAALVRTESIGAAGYELGYAPLVRLSRGERNKGNDRSHDSIFADCFEAVIGATYVDQGYDTAKRVIEEHILNKIDEIIEEGTWRDPKSYFQELTQRIDGQIPTYKLLTEEGPDHDKHFTVGLFVDDKMVSQGEGHSKQEAQTNAARTAIEIYKKKQKN